MFYATLNANIAPDYENPTVPANLSATAQSSSQINLSWSPSTDNVGVTGYRIYRGGAQIGTSATNSYSDTGLSASTNYSYTVQAYDAAGNTSPQSLSASATTQSSGSTPTSGCSGSGTSWSCAAGATTAQVQNVVNSASDGATVTFAAGSYSWSSISLNNIDGITLICASVGACNVSFNGGVFSRDYIPSTITRLIRISGFNFSGSANTAAIWLYGNNNIEQLRIDNNRFSLDASQIAILLGEISGSGNGSVWGVIDHNTFTGTNNFMGVKVLSGGSTWVTGRKGSQYNLFVENNAFNFNNNSDLGGGGLDAWAASTVVFRFNTLTNTRYVNHGLCHGGPVSVEVYGNTFSSPNSAAPNYRNVHFQGSGEIMAFNNLITGGHMALQHFRSDASQMPQGSCTAAVVCDGSETAYSDQNRSPLASNRGYACWHQPGRDGAGTLKPIYMWQNRDEAGRNVNVSIESGGNIDYHIKANRDYYEAVSANVQTSPTSPFNGTSGMGFGTLANRPTTCTTGPEAADAGNGGVGYWATDQGEWDSTHAGPDGQLYICSATNTWTLYYRPFTYPHPLQGGASSSDTENPSVPTNLSATAQSSSQINLSWSPSTDNVGVTGYRLERCQGASCTAFVQIATPAGTSYSDTGLAASMAYRYRVRATDAASNLSGYSSVAAATTQAGSVNNPPAGYLDGVDSNGDTFGWASDPDNLSATVTIHFYIDVNAGTAGATPAGSVSASDYRSDVGNHAFNWNIPSQYRNGQSHQLWAWAVDLTNPSVAAQLIGSPKSFNITLPDTENPTVPTGLTATAISSSQINLSWSPSMDNVGVTGYRIFRNGTQIATANATSYQNTGLSASTSYTYTVAAYDAANNVSGQSNAALATTQASPDTTAPAIITNLSASSVTKTSAVLSFTAPGDDNNVGTAASYDIRYFTSPITAANWASATQATGEPTPQPAGTNQSYSLTGLVAGTTYYAAIKTQDEVPNVSGLSNVVSFTTLSEDITGPVISAVSASGITASSAAAIWTTDEAADSQVEYGLTIAYGQSTALNPSLVTSHTVSLTGLTGNTTYHFRVKSKDGSGNLTVSGDYTFTTLDNIVPVISAVTASNVTANSANITWVTNESADSQVEYGLTTAYGQAAPVNPALTTSHTVSLTGLSASTVYHYRVKSKDASGNLAVSADYTFTTQPSQPADTTPPIISAVAVSQITTNTATITWTTNEPASSQVSYGKTVNLGTVSLLDTALVSSHQVRLTGLSKGITYYFKVHSADASNNAATFNALTFKTLSRGNKPPKATNVTASEGSVKLDWAYDKDFDGYAGILILRSTTGFIETVSTSSPLALVDYPKTNYHDKDVAPATTYYYSIFTYDTDGNYSDPSFVSFTTKVKKSNNSAASGGSGGGSAGGSGGSSGFSGGSGNQAGNPSSGLGQIKLDQTFGGCNIGSLRRLIAPR